MNYVEKKFYKGYIDAVFKAIFCKNAAAFIFNKYSEETKAGESYFNIIDVIQI